MSVSPSSGPVWFVQAAGQVWGPYGRARLEGFLAEGRLTAQSLLARESTGPFLTAGAVPEFARLFDKAPPLSPENYIHQSPPNYRPDAEPPRSRSAGSQGEPPPLKPRPPEPRQLANPVTSVAKGTNRPLVIWADCVSIPQEAFQNLLQLYGEIAPIRPGVWLVQARLDPPSLRNALSRHLTGVDALLILQTPLEAAAWFNLDSRTERPLRALWGRN
jgi:hypothetical protein